MENTMLAEAISLAADKHKEQTRRDGSPYIYHPMQVAKMVKIAGYGIKYQIVAILHDLLEDTDATDEDVRKFGEDVLIAVKLLTRAPDANEEDYVNAISQNHMAAVVKNADKIDNMCDAACCEDRQWAKRYVKKAKQYYEGKFSYALDRAIGNARVSLSGLNLGGGPTCYTQEELMLNSDRNLLAYDKCKVLYDQCEIRPNHSDSNIQYWYHELCDYYFCVLNDYVWKLSKAGWLLSESNPIQESEYGEELIRRNRDQIVQFVERKKAECYFYDFVDLSTL
jgi:GTP pyrophosphokinase